MTYQPPGGPQPDGQPAYAQPQDPWAGGYEQGVASVPTDPIPQQYESYPAPSGPDVWSQQTAPHAEAYLYAPQQRPKRAGLFITVFLLVLALGGGGGFAAWYIVTNGQANADPQPTIAASESGASDELPGSCPVTNDSGAFDPCTVQVGDCIVNGGNADEPDMQLSTCTETGSFTVLLTTQGPDIPEDATGKFDRDTTSATICKDVAGFEYWYGYNAVDDRRDVFFCLRKNVAP